MVVVHGLPHEIARAGLIVERHQALWVEVFRFPELRDVLITKL